MRERLRDLVIFGTGLAIGAWALKDTPLQITENRAPQSLLNTKEDTNKQSQETAEQKIAKAVECHVNREPTHSKAIFDIPPPSELGEIFQTLMENNRSPSTRDYLNPLLDDLSGSLHDRGQLLHMAAGNAEYVTEVPHDLFLEVIQNEIQRLREHAEALDKIGAKGDLGVLEYTTRDKSRILLIDVMTRLNDTHLAAFRVSAAQVELHGYKLEDSVISQIDWPDVFASFPAFCSLKTQVNSDASRSIEWTYDADKKSHDAEHCSKRYYQLEAPILVPPEER